MMLGLAMLALVLAGCETSPTAARQPEATPGGSLVTAHVGLSADSLAVDEPVRIEPEVVFSGEADTLLAKYNWKITKDGVAVELPDAASKVLDWIPAEPGNYSAHLRVEYGGKTVDLFVVVVIREGDGGAGKLAEIRKGMIGNWSGTVTTPWTPEHPIEMAFRGDGTYSARNPSPGTDSLGPTPALYYGTDEDHPLKTWFVDDVNASGEASGEIQIVFGTVYTTTRDALRRVKVSPDGKRMSFEMWHLGNYGPVAVELQRN
jgi:hypothetical protein